MATFWIDGAGRVVGAAVLTDRGETLAGELIVGPDSGALIPTMWQTVLERAAHQSTGGVEVSVDNDDSVTIALALDARFAPDPEVYVTCWLDAW